jgi:hypothetical protein
MKVKVACCPPRAFGQRRFGGQSDSQQSMEIPMSNEPKVIFDPKLNFELPREIGPLLEQTVSASVAEGFDACFELSLATQNTVASFEKQFAVAQADAKEMAEKLRSATTQNIDAAFGYALKLAQASTIQDYVEIQVDIIKTQAPIFLSQTQDLSRSLGKFVMHS